MRLSACDLESNLPNQSRRRPAKPMGSPDVGSNPTGVALVEVACRVWNMEPSLDCFDHVEAVRAHKILPPPSFSLHSGKPWQESDPIYPNSQ